MPEVLNSPSTRGAEESKELFVLDADRLPRTTKREGGAVPDQGNAVQGITDAKLIKRLTENASANSVPTTVYPATWKKKVAAIALHADGIVFAAGSSTYVGRYGLYSETTLTMSSGREGLLVMPYGDRWTIQFDSVQVATECLAAIEAGREAYQARQLPLAVGEHDRLVPRCTYLGGAFMTVAAGDRVDLAFLDAVLQIHKSPAKQLFAPIDTLQYARHFSVQLSGPGTVTTNGGFIGGGSGLLGAAEGIAIAAALNKLTTKTTTVSVIKVADIDHEAFLVNNSHGPEELRRILSPIFVRLNQQRSTPPSDQVSPDLITKLERLAALYSSGALTADEFADAKSAILRGV